jgi:hypothetical protein
LYAHSLSCRMFSFGLFSGVWSLVANISELFHLHRRVDMTECSETLAIKLHTTQNKTYDSQNTAKV